MIFSSLQEHIQKAISFASRGISPRPQIPILSCFLLKAEEGKVTIVATNLETTVISSFPAKTEKPGSICLPAKILSEFIHALPKETLSFTVEEEVVKLSCGRNKATMPATMPTEYPPVPEISLSSGEDISKQEFIDEAGVVLFSAAQDESRPLLTGIRIEAGEEGTTLAATDGYRLSVTKIQGKPIVSSESLIIPSRAIAEVIRCSNEEKTQQTIRLQETVDGQLVFTIGGTTLVTRRIDGDFPNYKKIIPQQFTTSVDVDKEELLRAAKSVALFARDSAGIIKFSVKEGLVEVSANTPQVGENTVEVEAQVSGEGLSVALNSRFVLEFLTTTKSELVTIQLTGALTPVVFKLPNKEEYTHIIMPVRVQS